MFWKPTIWVLKTPHTGDTNNRLAVAQAAAPDTTRLADFSTVRHDTAQLVQNMGGLPDIFIICEQETSRYAQDLKALSNGRVFVAGLQAPDIDNNDFDKPPYRDCVDMQLLFTHNKKTQDALRARTTDDAIVRKSYDFVPSRITPEFLRAEAARTGMTYDFPEKTPVYMAVLGSVVQAESAFGHSNWESFPREKALVEDNVRQMARLVARTVARRKGLALVTTSRRTPKSFLRIIAEEFTGINHHIHDWSKQGENPYFAMLEAANRIIVSADSMSMVSDALATGKPVDVYIPSHNPARKKSLCQAFAQTTLLREEVRRYMTTLAEKGLIGSAHALNARETSQPATINSAPAIGWDVLTAWQDFIKSPSPR